MALKLKTAEKVNEMEGIAFYELWSDAFNEMMGACKKFPAFPDEFAFMQKAGVVNSLAFLRPINDRSNGETATAETLTLEEYFEFMEAVIDRDAEKARKELVQVMAMLMRTYVHLDEYCKPV